MSSLPWRIVRVASIFVLIGACEAAPNVPTSVQCDGSGKVINALAGMKVGGLITDTYHVYKEFSDPNYSNTREEYKSVLRVDLDLTISADGTTVYGTAEVTWERHDRRVYRQNPANCSDGQLIDSNVRTWTVNILGNFFCDKDGKLGVTGEGDPDGSDIPTTYRYHDYGCHDGCAPCYDQTSPTSELVTWSSFYESGFTGNFLEFAKNLPLPAGFSGEWTHVVQIEIYTPPPPPPQ